MLTIDHAPVKKLAWNVNIFQMLVRTSDQFAGLKSPVTVFISCAAVSILMIGVWSNVTMLREVSPMIISI